MALKLGKCRLCLKLGDFFSIFTVDNSLQLAEMVMECSRVKVYEGDGLPDKICSECVQKLSSAFIFKQQCERADEELRRNYVPPPGFSISPPNRQSSDSAFSNQTDTSNQTKPAASNQGLITPVNRPRKRSRDGYENGSESSRSHEYRPSSAKRIDEIKSSEKKRRTRSPNVSNNDSDYDDTASHFSAATDSDDYLPRNFKCHICPTKAFVSSKSLANHMRTHLEKKKEINVDNGKKDTDLDNTVDDLLSSSKMEDALDVEDKLGCDNCGKTFKLKIMLKRHHEICKSPQKSPQKELVVALAQIGSSPTENRINCEMCTTSFKTFENLEKHMRVVHAAVPKQPPPKMESKTEPVPCIYCQTPFNDFYEFKTHFYNCPQKSDLMVFVCLICQKVIGKSQNYLSHSRTHFAVKLSTSFESEGTTESFQCRMCKQKLPSQSALVTHLAAHMANMEAMDQMYGEEDRYSLGNESIHSDYNCSITAGPLKCEFCDKRFKYKKALDTHKLKIHGNAKLEIKTEPVDETVSTSLQISKYRETESDSSQDEGDDNTCDICEKQFSYKRLLLQHKRTKHNMSSGTKRAKVNLKDCSVRCLICDIEMKVSAINDHNQKHIKANIKPKNLYTCAECSERFKSCSGLANHIKLVHRLKQVTPKQEEDKEDNVADFCEVVVTKSEPLDSVQSHNDPEAVPEGALVNLTGFNCPTCGKKMPTVISLKRHMNWHQNVGNTIEKAVECFVCKESFRFQRHYKLHMRAHYVDPTLDPALLTCSICGRRSKHLRAAMAHNNYHKQTRFANKDYQCAICKKVFQYRKVYLSHMAVHFKRGESSQNTIVGDYVPNNIDRKVFDGSHTCPHCAKVCDSEISLKHHISWHNSKTLLYGARHECYICHLQFTNRRRQELHIREHFEDDNGPFKCTVCGKGYTDEEYFKRHVKGHNFDHQSHQKRLAKIRKDKVKCPICNRYYPDVLKLIRHIKFTHPQSKMIKDDPDAPPQPLFSCKLCARVFVDEKRLQNHELSHSRRHEFFKCKFCGKNSMSMKYHNLHIKGHLTRKFEEPLKCTECDATFIKGYHLHHHLRDVHGINETWIAERGPRTLNGPLKEFQCSICFKILASKGNYERHIDYHNLTRCNYCFEQFNNLKFLEGHQAFSCKKKRLIGATDEYPKKVKCQICYKSFSVQVKLDCHLRTQHNIKVLREVREGQKETVCDYCFRVFENEDALISHKIYHRTVGYYGCIYCPRKFNTLTVYRKHKNHHFSQLNVDNPTKCEHCDKTFVAFREMIYHMRDEHGDDKEWLVMPKEIIEEDCPICKKTFFNLHRHLDYHEENRCKKCGEYFYSRTDYDNHLCSIESDEENDNNELDLRPKYEECRFCFKPITKISSKRKHDIIHRGSGAISCRFCNHKFKTMDAFNIHAFSHRNKKYNKNPLKCRKCGEKFVKYGPFIKHMRNVHKSLKKMHYRAVVKPEPCVVCKDAFPNLHNHYRAHLQNRCQLCRKYFTSYKLFSKHECDKEDSDPTKVFTCDEDLIALINSYVPQDEKDDEKYFGDFSCSEQTEENETKAHAADLQNDKINSAESQDEDSQNSVFSSHSMDPSPVISDVLSLSTKEKEDKVNGDTNSNVVSLSDDDSIDFRVTIPVITLDD